MRKTWFFSGFSHNYILLLVELKLYFISTWLNLNRAATDDSYGCTLRQKVFIGFPKRFRFRRGKNLLGRLHFDGILFGWSDGWRGEQSGQLLYYNERIGEIFHVWHLRGMFFSRMIVENECNLNVKHSETD